MTSPSTTTKNLSAPPTPFIQPRPTLPHPFHSDVSLNRCLTLFLPSSLHPAILPDLHRFGALVLSTSHIANIQSSEAHLPDITHYDTFGRRVDTLHTSEGWRASTRLAASEGIVALGYDTQYGRYARVYQFLKTHIWSPSSCGVTCPSAMQDGAAALLARHVRAEETTTPPETKEVLRRALERLLSRDPDRAWTSGQWMTERPGGSDVSRTETRAHFVPAGLEQQLDKDGSAEEFCASDGSPLGPWVIEGYKWFSSATDANMTVLLAKTEDGSDASSGHDSTRVSAFFAPLKVRRRSRARETPTDPNAPPEQGVLEYNNISIPRLKRKLGTRSLPTAELSLHGTRAYLLGAPGHGTKEISAILNITRIHTAVGAVGAWARGLAISKAYARVRTVGGGGIDGRLLTDTPAHVRGLAERDVEYRACMLFTFFAVALLGAVEYPEDRPRPSSGSPSAADDASPAAPLFPAAEGARSMLLRLLTPVLKSSAALAAIAGLRFCMESLGGVGYLENEDAELNVARLFRDTCVLSIWEGTTDVLAADCVRVLKGKGGEEVMGVFVGWVGDAMETWGGRMRKDVRGLVSGEMGRLEETVRRCDVDALLYRGREVMERIAWLVCVVLLYEDASRDGDAVAWEIARRWVGQKSKNDNAEAGREWKEDFEWDRRIVFGTVPDLAKL